MSTSTSTGISWKWFFNFLAFCATALIGLALLIALIAGKGKLPLGSNGVAGAFMMVSEILAYAVVSFYGFFYAWRKRSTNKIVHMCIWAVSVILIIVCLIVGNL